MEGKLAPEPTNHHNRNNLQGPSGDSDQSAPGPPVSTTLSSGPHMVFSPPTPLGRRKRASVTCSTSRRNPQRTAARGRKKPDQTTRGPGRDANEARPVRERITPERAGARAEAGSRATFACRGRGGGPGSARSRTAAAGRGRRAARAAPPAPWPATGLRCANMAPTKVREQMRSTITMGLVAVLATLSAGQAAAQAPPGGQDAGDRIEADGGLLIDRIDPSVSGRSGAGAPASTSWAWDCWRRAARWASRSRAGSSTRAPSAWRSPPSGWPRSSSR